MPILEKTTQSILFIILWATFENVDVVINEGFLLQFTGLHFKASRLGQCGVEASRGGMGVKRRNVL